MNYCIAECVNVVMGFCVKISHLYYFVIKGNSFFVA